MSGRDDTVIPMSTNWAYLCQSHQPHLASTDNWFENFNGKTLAAEVYRTVRAGQWPTDDDGDPMPVVQGDYSTAGPIYWLRQHLGCRVALVGEQGHVEQLGETGEATVVHEWHVTGEPGPIGAVPDLRYPSYQFAYRSDDERWPGRIAEDAARTFVQRVSRYEGGWEDGPHLHHRTVVYSPLEPVDVRIEPGAEPLPEPSNVVSLTIKVTP